MKKIIHFEDDELLKKMYEEKFRKAGFEYKGYEHPPLNPTEIIELILTEKPDLILMNVIMPVMDGFEATKIIKADSRTKNIPICFFTNMSQRNDINRGLALGAIKYFIYAQYSPNELIKEINKILSNVSK